MKRFTLLTAFFLVFGVALQAQVDTTLVSLWGQTIQGRYWPMVNDSNTTAGEAGIHGATAINGAGQATLRGEFNNLTATIDTAVVVSGKLELVGTVGGEDSYNPLRFALAYHADDTLNYALTDSANWIRRPGYGYIFTPRTGAGTVANGAWGTGTVGVLNNGNWNSTNSNGGKALATVLQAPRNAKMLPGIYDWAISVIQVNDTTNEIKWYLKKEDNKYWYGGTVTGPAVTHQFNGISFGVNTGDWTQVNLTEVSAKLGSPIDIPEAPWQAYYVDQWGQTIQGRYWPILNDSDYVVGDATIAGAAPINGAGQATLRGGFGQNLQIKTDQELIVRGELELVGAVGGEDSYNPLRFALAYHESDTLKYALTDSANWVRRPGYGYIFTPRTGAGTVANGAWGTGTVGVLNNGNWNSTNSNGGPALATVLQAPRNAKMVPGTYQWAISVRQINDTTNQIKWYLKEEDNKYWYGGTVTGPAVTHQLNGISFGVNTGDWTQINIIGAQVDYGTITIPEAPWQAYYVDQWGQTPQGRYWPVLNDSDYVVGDAGIAGAAPINGAGQATIRGGFGQNLQVKTDQELIVRGELELVGAVGGEDSYNPLRFALAYHESDTLKYALTDSANWVRRPGWGYIFTPRTGAGTVANGAWGTGTVGVLNNGNWNSTNSNGGPALATVLQAPRNAKMVPGTYQWAISVRQINDTTNQIKWYLKEEDNNYWYGGTVTGPAVTHQFNAINFGVNTGDWTQVNIIGAQVDYGSITVPEPPFEPYFVDQWGFFGNKIGGWSISDNDIVGNVTVSGSAANNDWVAVRGAFETFTPSLTKPLKITGNVELVGGGFDVSGSLRVGLFYTGAAGSLLIDTASATLPDSTRWAGTDTLCSGYLFLPQSGSNGAVNWAGISQQGTWGAVVNNTWLNTDAPNNYVLGSQVPNPSTSGAVVYDFELSVTPQGPGSNMVKFNLMDGTYKWVVSAIDNHNPLVTDKFNSIAFALNAGNPVTALKLTNVQIDSGTITGVNSAKNLIPTQFALGQNYPNPFNPSTTIEFALPIKSDVSLVVYDLLGKKVTELAKGSFNAGYHQVRFNASNLASGVYFYSIKAGDFVSVKKLMLLK